MDQLHIGSTVADVHRDASSSSDTVFSEAIDIDLATFTSQIDALVTVAQVSLKDAIYDDTIVRARMKEVKDASLSVEPQHSTDNFDNQAELPSLSPSSISAQPSSDPSPECTTNSVHYKTKSQLILSDRVEDEVPTWPVLMAIEEQLPDEIHIRKITSETSTYVNMVMNDVHIPVLIDTGCVYTLLPRQIFDKTGLPFNPLQHATGQTGVSFRETPRRQLAGGTSQTGVRLPDIHGVHSSNRIRSRCTTRIELYQITESNYMF